MRCYRKYEGNCPITIMYCFKKIQKNKGGNEVSQENAIIPLLLFSPHIPTYPPLINGHHVNLHFIHQYDRCNPPPLCCLYPSMGMADSVPLIHYINVTYVLKMQRNAHKNWSGILKTMLA